MYPASFLGLCGAGEDGPTDQITDRHCVSAGLTWFLGSMMCHLALWTVRFGPDSRVRSSGLSPQFSNSMGTRDSPAQSHTGIEFPRLSMTTPQAVHNLLDP